MKPHCKQTKTQLEEATTLQSKLRVDCKAVGITKLRTTSRAASCSVLSLAIIMIII